MFNVNSIDNRLNFAKNQAVYVGPVSETIQTEENVVLALMAELAQYGYTLSKDLYQELQHVELQTVIDIYVFLTQKVKESVGANVTHTALFGNFPLDITQDTQQLLNQVSYAATLSGQQITFNYGTDTELQYETDLTVIDRADKINSGHLFTNLCGSKVSLSGSDKEMLVEYIQEHKDKALKFMPQEVNSKENLAVAMVAVQRNTTLDKDVLMTYLKTATDVLRVACEMADGDSTLKENTKFKLKNSERKFIMQALDNIGSPQEDMLRYKGAWIKLAECLHTGSFKKRFPFTFKAVQDLRENVKIETFNSKVEALVLCITNGDKTQAKPLSKLLATRPGEFARRLDFVLRECVTTEARVLAAEFCLVTSQVSTPVLLKLRSHLNSRTATSEFRHFIPKGNCGKVKVFPGDDRPALRKPIVEMVTRRIDEVLTERFAERDSLGHVFIHEDLANKLVPLVQRDITEGTKTLARGSRVSFAEDSKFVRPFLYWKEVGSRVDVDLSAVAFGHNWEPLGNVGYHNLRDGWAEHSGDFTSAPNGASEFLNIDIDKAVAAGKRYVAIVVNIFSGAGAYNEFECFSGFQERVDNTGKNFEATTVKNKFDLVSDSSYNVPVVMDLVSREMIWCDLSLNGGAACNSNSEETGVLALTKICQGMLNTNPTVLDLLKDHVGRMDSMIIGAETDLQGLLDDGYEVDNVFTADFATEFNRISSDFL